MLTFDLLKFNKRNLKEFLCAIVLLVPVVSTYICNGENCISIKEPDSSIENKIENNLSYIISSNSFLGTISASYYNVEIKL